jgi:hypothetical protein
MYEEAATEVCEKMVIDRHTGWADGGAGMRLRIMEIGEMALIVATLFSVSRFWVCSHVLLTEMESRCRMMFGNTLFSVAEIAEPPYPPYPRSYPADSWAIPPMFSTPAEVT